MLKPIMEQTNDDFAPLYQMVSDAMPPESALSLEFPPGNCKLSL